MTCVCHAFESVHCCLVAPAGNGMASHLSFVMFNCVFVTFPCGILGQVWYLIVLIPDLSLLFYMYHQTTVIHKFHEMPSIAC